MQRALMAWSGGKDSAMALHQVRAEGKYEIEALLTIVTGDYARVSMHGVRRSLLEQQTASLGLKLEEVVIPKEASNELYEERMARALSRYKDAGVESVVFGDIFLEDLRQYREKNLNRLGMRGLFPLWKRETAELMDSFLASGFRAVTVCVDNHALGQEFVGRTIDRDFISQLPARVDVCGENGEFHSFVYGGPIFDHAIPHERGQVVLRNDRFYYCDLTPAAAC